ncbi:60S ribosomal protein L3, partial [Bienertia sinuspersici]
WQAGRLFNLFDSYFSNKDEGLNAKEGSSDGKLEIKKVDYAYGFYNILIQFRRFLLKDEMIDSIGITKGKVYEGVVTRCGVTRFPPVSYIVVWVGQNGYHHHTEMSKTISKLGMRNVTGVMTKYDRTEKDITPIGGFPRYDVVKEIKLKFIDTSSKLTGPWSIPEQNEKQKFMV